MTGRYLEDFAVGQTFGSGRLRVEKERIQNFRRRIRSAAFHLEKRPRAARYSGLGGERLATASMTMRLLVEAS